MNNGPKIQHNTIILPAHESESIHFCFPPQADTKENSSPSRAKKRTFTEAQVELTNGPLYRLQSPLPLVSIY